MTEGCSGEFAMEASGVARGCEVCCIYAEHGASCCQPAAKGSVVFGVFFLFFVFLVSRFTGLFV